MGRSPCCDNTGLKKGPWTLEEDEKLVQYIQKHGHGSWRALPILAGLNRCGKSCRLRWTNYLRPDIKRGRFSTEEEQIILNLHSVLGNKWSAIAQHLPGRTDNEVKNFWNTNLKKKLIKMGFDPMTHQPRADFFGTLTQLIALTKLQEVFNSHPWDDHAVRLQATKLHCLQHLIQSTVTALNCCNTNNSSATSNNELPSTNLLGPQLGSLPLVSSETLLEDCNAHCPVNQLPDIQIPCSVYDQLVINDINYQNSNITECIQRDGQSPPSPLIPQTSLLLTDLSVARQEDVSSTTSCGANVTSPFWSEFLLGDQLMAEFD